MLALICLLYIAFFFIDGQQVLRTRSTRGAVVYFCLFFASFAAILLYTYGYKIESPFEVLFRNFLDLGLDFKQF